MITAELFIVETSPTCSRYTLVADGVIIWRNRVEPTEAGDAGARSRMAAWALKHDVTVVEKQAEGAPKQAIIQGRYGRH